jgi:hypothetical protein
MMRQRVSSIGRAPTWRVIIARFRLKVQQTRSGVIATITTSELGPADVLDGVVACISITRA